MPKKWAIPIKISPLQRKKVDMKIIYVVENILMICVPTSFVFANIVMCAKNAKNQKIHCQIFYTTTSCFP